MNQKPNVFVSSTCYDLRQVRHDLREVIEGFGFVPMLSEFPSFPVDPDKTTVENCVDNVKRHADIFILIVGNRYGSTDEQGRSVTNLEYLAARNIGIPMYIFALKDILTLARVWKESHDSNIKFPGIDSVELLKFMDHLLCESGKWVFSFESAQDIAGILREQWATLFAGMLQIRKRIQDRPIPKECENLRPLAQRILYERPDLWEYRLLGQVLSDGIDDLRNARRNYELKLAFRAGKRVKFRDFGVWAQNQIAEGLRIPKNLMRLFEGALQRSLGPPGVAGDPVEIVHVAQGIVACYRMALEWAEEVRSTNVHSELQNAIDLMAQMMANVLREVEEWIRRIEAIPKQAASVPEGSEATISVDLILTVDQGVLDRFQQELSRVTEVAERGEIDLDEA